jgi:hypothetical protein
MNFLADMGIPPRGLAKRHEELSGARVNWLGTYQHAAQVWLKGLEEFWQSAFDLKYAGRRVIENEEQPRNIYGITYIDDLRPRIERNLD